MVINEIAKKIALIDNMEILVRFRPGFNQFFSQFTRELHLKFGDTIEDFLLHKWKEENIETLYERIFESFIEADLIIINPTDEENKKEYKYDEKTQSFLLVKDYNVDNLFAQQTQKIKELEKIIDEANQRFQTSIHTESELIQFLNEKIKTVEYHNRNNLLKNTLMKYRQLNTNQ